MTEIQQAHGRELAQLAPFGKAQAGHTRLGFSTQEKRARVATAGARLPVVIDPADRSSVTLDLDALGF